MLIKLTKTSYVLSGGQRSQKCDRVIKEEIWINPNYIATAEPTKPSFYIGIEGEFRTNIVWGSGRMGGNFHVSETPEQIMELIKSA